MDTFLGKTILVFTAHPDDETFGMGGTIHKNQQKGGRTFVVCATYGEKGSSHLSRPMSETEIKAVRKKELLAAARFLKVSKLYFLNLPDGKLKDCGARLFNEGINLARRLKPDAILSFGRYGMSGHLDHIAVGQASRSIAYLLRLPLYTLTIPPALVKEFVARLKARRHNPHYTKDRPIFENPSVKIAVNSKIKLRAASFHKSQLGGGKPFASLPPALRRLRLSAEYFSRQN